MKQTEEDRLKVCPRCRLSKPLEAFSRAGEGKRKCHCKECIRAAYRANRETVLAKQAEYSARNREEILARRAEIRIANRDKIREQAREFYWANRNQIRASQAEYRLLNKDRLNEYNSAYQKANRDKIRADQKRLRERNPGRSAAYGVAYRASKLKALPAWADHSKIREFYLAADFLSMVTGEWYQVDHIVPLRGKTVCGLHWEANLEVVTKRYNIQKQNRYWPDMAWPELADSKFMKSIKSLTDDERQSRIDEFGAQLVDNDDLTTRARIWQRLWPLIKEHLKEQSQAPEK